MPTSIPSTRVLPSEDLIDEAARMLLTAEKPTIFVGDGVAYSDATEELKSVAEMLGAEVYGVEFGDFIMDNTHPLYQGTTGHMFGSHSLPITTKGDCNLVVGTYMLPEVFPHLGEIYHPEAKVIHFDLNDYEIAKNHRVDLGVVCDPKLSLQALLNRIGELMTEEQKKKVAGRITHIGDAKQERIDAEKALDSEVAGSTPIVMSDFAQALADKLPEDYVIFDEALTSSPPLTRYIPPRNPGSIFYTRGGSLGIGIPGAIGVKIKHPEKTVIGFTGDGGSMYTIQALWSAVRHKVGAKFVVCNNGSYHLLQLNIDQYWKEQDIQEHDFPIPFDLSYPALHFDKIAQSMGVKSVRVEKPEQISAAI